MGASEQQKTERRHNWRLFRLLLLPSWISGFACLLLSTSATVAILVQGHYEGSELQRQLYAWQQSGDGSWFQLITTEQSSQVGKVLNTIQLFVFWYAVGLVVYALASALFKAVQEIRELRDDLHSLNSNHSQVWRAALVQFLRQLGALFAWLLLVVATLKAVVPYALGTVDAANEYLPDLEAIGLIVVATFAMAACLHLHVVLVRLFLGRPRIWHSEDSIESIDADSK
jgi:hypothetical protein